MTKRPPTSSGPAENRPRLRQHWLPAPGPELHGHSWWPRRDIKARQTAGDQRSTPRETAVQALAAEIAHPDSHQPSAADLAARDGISIRTARRRLAAARGLPPENTAGDDR
ncbi:hypothetical protein ACIRP0_36785 [Streptomyces sp. NPDC101733]|uniref:hypothetical protein n=1 Tax=unclassified Streptomyces TaxID=2593676 RepID=UPI0038039D06